MAKAPPVSLRYDESADALLDEAAELKRAFVAHGSRQVVDCLAAEQLQLTDPGAIPTKDEFRKSWQKLVTKDQRNVVKTAIEKETIEEMRFDLNNITAMRVVEKFKAKNVMNTIYMGKILKLPTERAQRLFNQALIDATAERAALIVELMPDLKSDDAHIKELADAIDVDGDGKREQLKKLIAYGMQAKMVEVAQRNLMGDEISPAIYSLADPKVALNAIQELNKMDHEYAADEQATSSIETQAERVLRIKDSMDKRMKEAANAVGGVANSLTEADMDKDMT